MGTPIPDKTQENILLTEVECRYGQGWRFTVLKRDTKQFLFSDTFKRRPAGMKTLAKHILEGYGVALMTGKVSGVVVVDVDLYKGAKIPAGTPLTATVRTPRGGVHVYFALPEGMEVPTLSAEQSRWGVEVKSDKHAVVYPGSRHAVGATYRWAKGLSPDDMPLAPFPEWLAERKEAVEPYTRAAERVQAADERNAVLNREVWKLRQRFGENLDEERLDIVRCAALDAGLAPTEVQRTIDSALQAPLVRHQEKDPYVKLSISLLKSEAVVTMTPTARALLPHLLNAWGRQTEWTRSKAFSFPWTPDLGVSENSHAAAMKLYSGRGVVRLGCKNPGGRTALFLSDAWRDWKPIGEEARKARKKKTKRDTAYLERGVRLKEFKHEIDRRRGYGDSVEFQVVLERRRRARKG